MIDTADRAALWFLLPYLYDKAAAPIAWLWGDADLAANDLMTAALGVPSTSARKWSWPNDSPRLDSRAPGYYPCCFPDPTANVTGLMARARYVSDTFGAIAEFLRALGEAGVPLDLAAGIPQLDDRCSYFVPRQYVEYPDWLAANDVRYSVDPEHRRQCFETHAMSPFFFAADDVEAVLSMGQDGYLLNAEQTATGLSVLLAPIF